jgi:hypothetical protein
VNRTIRIAHLVMGLLFLGIAAVWLLHATGVLSADQLALSGPVVLIAAGVVGLAVSLTTSGRGDRPQPLRYDDPSVTATNPESIETDKQEDEHHE